AVDPEVPVGSASYRAARLDDRFFAEAEWCVGFPDGRPDEVTAETAVVVQGLLEGKWLNRLLGTRAWRPASIGNKRLADRPGIRTTLGALDSTEGWVRVTFPGGSHESSLADLARHNIRALVAEVLAAESEVEWVDLGAFGPRSATVNEPARLKAAANPRPHRAKEKLIRAAIADGVGVPPGEEAGLVGGDGAGDGV